MKKHALAPGLSLVLLFLGDAAQFYSLGLVKFTDAKRKDKPVAIFEPSH